MAYITRIRMDAFGESASEIETLFNLRTTLIQQAVERHVSVVHEVIEMGGLDGATNSEYKGRRILALDISPDMRQPSVEEVNAP